MDQPTYSFLKALPVWKEGDKLVMNQSLVLEYNVKRKPVNLHIACHSAYTVLVNGVLCAYGPARCAHGYHKVDEIHLESYLSNCDNIITLRLFGYNVKSYEFANSTSFVCAELVSDGEVIAYTDTTPYGFRAYLNSEKIVKTPRFSPQRTFTECYDLCLGENAKPEIKLSLTDEKRFIARDVPYGEYDRIYPSSVIHMGETYFDNSAEPSFPAFISDIGVSIEGYSSDELSEHLHIDISRIKTKSKRTVSLSADMIELKADSFADVEFPCNNTGIPAFEIESDGEGELLMIFDECLTNGDVDPFRLKVIGGVSMKYCQGRRSIVAAEPYVMKYARFIALGHGVRIISPHLIEIAFPMGEISTEFRSDDEDMRRIYNAALESFRANVTDVYMDCPSRERAGWLCDSYFTARAEYSLTGKSRVERAFLLNYIYHGVKEIKDGMLPMCYPADHPHGRFIPNWAMWYLLELYEYYERSGDIGLIEMAKPKMYTLLEYFHAFENEYGLLESLESWVFVEWSRANELVQDVSFATNMLYALFKDKMGRLYNDPALTEEADKLRAEIRRMSMTPSGFFSDNAVRIDGKLVTTGERTEVCQYYAFYTGTATIETHPKLWSILVNDFGPDRKEKGVYQEIYEANSLPGNYLRLDLLERAGLYDKLYDEIRGYFVYMADRTGTLWEHISNKASMNHGFASHVIYWMEKLGLIKKNDSAAN